MISLLNIIEPNKPEINIAKLKAIDGESNTFGLYNLGLNQKTKQVQDEDARREFGTFVFWYQKNLANDSKMSNLMRNITAIFPAVEQVKVERSELD